MNYREISILELVDSATGNLIRGATISSGSVTSKEFRLLGYREFELIIDADQDFTVEIQYLAPSGNWRTFDLYTSISKRLHLLMDEHLPAFRIVITPATYPMTVNECFIVLVP